MLYDPTWNKTPSIEGLIAWLETQDPATTYDWKDVHGCLVCAYYNALGINNYSLLDRPLYRDTFNGNVSLYHKVAAAEPWTFSAALARARKAAAEM